MYTDLIIELLHDNGDILSTKKLPIIDGIATGDFPLPDSLPHGFYFLRAYHRGMVESGNARIPLTPIAVVNPANADENYRQPLKTGFQLKVFPESGNFIAGLNNNLILQAIGPHGKGTACSGIVTNKSGDTVVRFQTSAEGYGSLSIQPMAGNTYQAIVNFADGSARNYRFPVPEKQGILLKLADNSKGKIFQVQETDSLSYRGKLQLTGRMFNRTVFRETLRFDNHLAGGVIPLNQLPPGLLQLMVVDEANQPYARRPTFIYGSDLLAPITLRTDTISFSRKGVNSFMLAVPDSVEAVFSASVEVVNETEILPAGSIEADLLWNAELSTPLNLASVELVNPSKETRWLNDFRLQAEEWASSREVNGRENIQENYIRITGDIFREGSAKPVTSGELAFLIHTRDSTTAFLSAPVLGDGSFVLDHLIFEGLAKFDYRMAGKKSPDIEIRLREPDQPVNIPASPPAALLARLPLDRMHIQDSSRLAAFVTMNRRAIDTARGVTLGEVRVSSRALRPVDIVNKKYTRGLFGSMNASIFDMVNEPPKPASQRILDFLIGKVAGLHIERRGNNYSVTSTRAMSITGGLIPVQIFLNEMPVMADELLSLTVADVALVKYFKAGSNMMAGFGISGKLAIYTRAAEDAHYDDTYLHAFSYRGYSPVDSFTQPDYSAGGNQQPDNRATRCWIPNGLILEGSREFPIRFYNSDTGKKFRVTVKGYTMDGRLISLQQIIQ